MFKLLSVGRDRGHIRLKYITGDRALKAFNRSLALSFGVGKLLACDVGVLESRVAALLQERKENAKERKELSEELASAVGKQLGAKMSEANEVENQVLQFYRPGADVQFLNAAANALFEEHENGIALLTSDDVFLLAGHPPSRVDKVKKQVLELIGGRGGGKPGRVQGKATALEHREDSVRLIKEILTKDALDEE